jgi:hypothetical protein
MWRMDFRPAQLSEPSRCLTDPDRARKLGHTFEAVNRPG